jgi:hypothetical protein
MKLTRRGERVRDALLTLGMIACLLAAAWLEAHPDFPF